MQRAVANLGTALEKRSTTELEFRLRRHDGVYRRFSVRFGVLQFVDGVFQPDRLVLHFNDYPQPWGSGRLSKRRQKVALFAAADGANASSDQFRIVTELATEPILDNLVDAVRQGFGTGSEPAALVEALRPAAGDGARVIFGLQLERAIAELLADTKRLRRR